MTSSGVERRDRPTMRDVAALAGVGIKTVSRVVNDVPTVAPDLAERVRAAADKLGYRPNLTASNLRRGDKRTHTIGLLVDNVGNPFASTVLRAVEDFFRRRDVLVLAASLDEDADRESELAKTLIDRRVDGLIVMPADHDHRYLVPEQQAGTQFVFIDRRPSPLIADAVVTDNRTGARRAVEHLLATPRRKLAYLGDLPTIPTAQERFLGFQDAVAAAGDAVREPPAVRHGLRTEEQARAALSELLAGDPPDALFTSRNTVTVGAVRVLHELGLERQVALVGFDDIPLADLLRPGITVMTQDPAEIGRRAAQRLLDRLDGDHSPPTVDVLQPVLVERGSGELGR